MTDIWMTCGIIAAWLKANEINAPPLAILYLTNIILQVIGNVREEAYQQGQHDARKEIDGCKQP